MGIIIICRKQDEGNNKRLPWQSETAFIKASKVGGLSSQGGDGVQKTMHTNYGDMDIIVHRGRKGEFKPQVVKKYQNTVTQNMEEKIISMYARGMTIADIESHMRELYDIDVSDITISRITDKFLHSFL